MSGSSIGKLFVVTNFGESHGPAIGCVIDGCPPGMPLSEADIQPDLDRRRPGQSKFVTQRKEADAVKILSGVYEGVTTGTPIALLIENTDQRSRDYSEVARQFRDSGSERRRQKLCTSDGADGGGGGRGTQVAQYRARHYDSRARFLNRYGKASPGKLG